VTRGAWTIVVSAPGGGLWRASAHRSDPDGWAMLPGRWATEGEALAAAEAWLPTPDPWRLSAPAPTAEPEPDAEPDEDADAEPQPAVALPGQLDLFGARL
jgi:hypothetical protein